ncbi:23S rRNA (guanosine(2251)-2'-O)-methyltransferase RlmB [Psychroflexus salis]|uniref:23S rRNA (Guanosine(2251)-2'-O)-methyltransferase RlmB n=1 Tax=Psychroflexus salis TaxID=1526574 RepID=A0A916ZN06_9FLAO|nr:23S rRNA (guanosine(2251)-2'-O)-methyltransferase RlmB [Psychroflexus salis]GGE05589.1 23S rRNA (guanosine(2251)-2'-O)-methyltransferase RlmB [Psychroflexus salis]
MEKEEIIYGAHSVIEALKNEKAIEKILLNKGQRNEFYEEINQLAKKQQVKISFVPQVKFKKYEHLNHQEIIAFVSPIEFLDFEKTIEDILTKKDNPLFLVLDGVTDVRNLGSIIRTAECTGVDAIILPKNNSAGVNKDTVKTSAGAIYNIPICKVDHVHDALFYFQSSGIQLIAATEKTENYIYSQEISSKLALIMGDENKGISSSTLKQVDLKVKLPLLGNIESLNVSVACGALLYEIVRRRI